MSREASDLRSKTVDELRAELLEIRKEQFNLRMQNASGQTVRPHQFKEARRNVARIKTILNERLRETQGNE
jgi:large subunit ribosomal protein L29